jgi:hypothetical protein
MISAVVVSAVILLVLIPAIRRMLDLQKIPWLAWPVMLAAGAFPSYMAYNVLNPEFTGAKAEVRQDHEKDKRPFSLEVPGEGYALMVTALLGPEQEDVPADKTAYTLRYELGGQEHRVLGTIRRKSGDDSIDVNSDVSETMRETGRRRSGGLGEDLQDRFDLEGGAGTLTGRVANWDGEAAAVLFLEVVKAPPPEHILWLIAILISAGAIVVEVKYGAEKFTGDIGFLAMYAVFIRDGVTPLDTYKGVGLAVLPAAIVGWFLVAGIAFLINKYTRVDPRDSNTED